MVWGSRDVISIMGDEQHDGPEIVLVLEQRADLSERIDRLIIMIGKMEKDGFKLITL